MKFAIVALLFFTSLNSNEFVVDKKTVKIDYVDDILEVSGQILKCKNQFDLVSVNIEKELLGLFDLILKDKFELNEQNSKKVLQELQELDKSYKKYKTELENKLQSIQKKLKQ